MDIAVKKIELIAWLTNVKDEALLKEIDSLKKKSLAAAHEGRLRPMTSTEYKSLLDQAEDDLENGKVTTQDDLEKEVSDW